MLKKDNFKLHYFHNASFVGELESPLLKYTEAIAKNVFSYSEINSVKNPSDCYIDFFVDDYRFEKLLFLPYFSKLKTRTDVVFKIKETLVCIKDVEIYRLYNQLDKVIKRLSKFAGVITPDFSLYPEMPIFMRKINCFRSRTVAYHMQQMGLNIIPSVAWANEEDFSFCFDGIPKNSSVAISLNGCKHNEYSKNKNLLGIEELQRTVKPKHLIICGKPFPELLKYDNIISYPSFSERKARRKEEAQIRRDGQLSFDFNSKKIITYN